MIQFFNKYKNNRIVFMPIITKDTMNNTHNLVTYRAFSWIAFTNSLYKIKDKGRYTCVTNIKNNSESFVESE